MVVWGGSSDDVKHRCALLRRREGGGEAASPDCTIVFVQSWTVGSFSCVKNSTQLRELVGVSQVRMAIAGDFWCGIASRAFISNLNLFHADGAVGQILGLLLKKQTLSPIADKTNEIVLVMLLEFPSHYISIPFHWWLFYLFVLLIFLCHSTYSFILFFFLTAPPFKARPQVWLL